MSMLTDDLDGAVVAQLRAVVKARPPSAEGGRRIIEVQASCEAVDLDGDVVLQQALLGSAAGFLAHGHLDIDHLSEFGTRLGIPDPESYIVGRPLDVTDKGQGNTFVTAELARGLDGRSRADGVWDSLRQDPPVRWLASIYGFPTEMDDCAATGGACAATGATRFVIKAIDWRSLALTRNPKNTALTGAARIVTAKAYLAELAKAMPSPTVPLPNTMADVWAQHACPHCGVHDAPSLLGYRQHFAACKGYPTGAADLYAHAVMYRRNMGLGMPTTAL